MIASNRLNLVPKPLASLIESLHQAQSVIDVLQTVGQILQDQFELTAVWIGYPAMMEDALTTCYWVVNPQDESQPFQIRLDPQLLQQLAQAPEHMVLVTPEELPTLSLSCDAYTLADTQFPGSESSHSVWSQYPQLLVAAYPQQGSAWIMGLVSTEPEQWTATNQFFIQVLLQMTLSILEYKTIRQQALNTAQVQRTAANRLMDWFRVASEASRQVVYEWDLQTDQIEWSTSLPFVLGHLITTDTEKRSWWSDRIHPEDRLRVLRQVSQSLTDLQVFMCEYRWQRADGYYAWVRDYGRVFCGPQGQPVRMLGSLEDTTARHSTAEALNQLKQSFKILAESSSTAILVITPDLRIIDANTACLNWLGYDSGTLEQLENLTLILHPADLNADVSELNRLINHQISSYTTQKRFYHALGYELLTTIQVKGIHNQQGQLSQMIWLIVPNSCSSGDLITPASESSDHR